MCFYILQIPALAWTYFVRALLHTGSYPGTYYVDQAGIELLVSFLPAFGIKRHVSPCPSITCLFFVLYAL